MTRADRLLVLTLAALALLAWPLAATAAGAGERITISGPTGTTTLALDDTRSLEVEGRTGTVSVIVEQGSVCVSHAECPDQVCVKTGPVSAAGAVIACVPNGVVVQIEGSGSNEFDARIR